MSHNNKKPPFTKVKYNIKIVTLSGVDQECNTYTDT